LKESRVTLIFQGTYYSPSGSFSLTSPGSCEERSAVISDLRCGMSAVLPYHKQGFTYGPIATRTICSCAGPDRAVDQQSKCIKVAAEALSIGTQNWALLR